MDWQQELLLCTRILIASVLGAFVGLERELHKRDAGLRTYAAVSMGACMFALVSQHIPGVVDPSRLAANIVSGVGFIGAGMIMRSGDRAFGLTTAATVWGTAAVGTAVGFGMYAMGVAGAVLIFTILASHHLAASSRDGASTRERVLEGNDDASSEA